MPSLPPSKDQTKRPQSLKIVHWHLPREKNHCSYQNERSTFQNFDPKQKPQKRFFAKKGAKISRKQIYFQF
jgi:hypothetical protein